MVDTERCKHWMLKGTCTYCNPAAPKPKGECQRSPRAERRKGRRFQRTSLAGMWSVVGFLAARASTQIQAKDEELATECEAEYQLATGEEVEVGVNSTKWGHSVSFFFLATDVEMLHAGIALEQLSACTRNEHSRLLSNAALGWALFDLGFRVNGGQDVARIRENVPEHNRVAFDRGVAIGETLKPQ